MDSAVGLQASPWRGCPIRTSPDHSLLAAPRGLSQPSTSFIGSWCQGIHRAPLLARRLDLSQLQAGRINVLKKRPTCLSLHFAPSTALGIGGTEPVSVSSHTLWFFRYSFRLPSTSAFVRST